jgi:hypothetical protein
MYSMVSPQPLSLRCSASETRHAELVLCDIGRVKLVLVPSRMVAYPLGRAGRLWL